MPPTDRTDSGRGAKLRRQRAQFESSDKPGASAKFSRTRLFRDIPVVPTLSLYANSQLADGGPIWPSFDTRGAIRHNRKGMIVDRPPLPRSDPHKTIDRPCVWGGFAMVHFGHLISEHLTRVLESVTERPDDMFLFVARPGEDASHAPDYFWAILAWYGLPRDQVIFVTEPLLVAELRVMPQAEQMAFGAPTDAYLDLLEQIPQARGLVPVKTGIIYVTRVGLLPRGKGGHAGESYLVARLAAGGVRVLDPAKVPLPEQLALYAGAKVIMFAEGSAIHGRQLLGRLPQQIFVLQRRPDKAVAMGILAKRCDQPHYVEATTRFVSATAQSGRAFDAKGISFYDLAELQACFRDLGVDLATGWSQREYCKRRDADAIAWVVAMRAMVSLTKPSTKQIFDEFGQEGIRRPRLAAWWNRLKHHPKSLFAILVGRK